MATTWTRFICFLRLCQWLSLVGIAARRSERVTLGLSCSISLCWASLLHAYLLRYAYFILILMQRFLDFLTWHGNIQQNFELFNYWSGMANTWTRLMCFLWLCQWLSLVGIAARRSECMTLRPSCSISLFWASLLHAYLLRYAYFNVVKVLIQRFVSDTAQKYSTISLTIELLICLWPSLERVEAWQILGQDSCASCGCASDWVLIETRRWVQNVWLWAHLVA